MLRSPTGPAALAACLLLLTAAGCVPGEGPRPPSRSRSVGIGGFWGPVAGRPMAGASGATPLAGTGTVPPPPPPPPPAGTGSVPGGQAGLGGGTPVAGFPAPQPDGGAPSMREFDAGTEPDRNMVGPGDVCRRLSELQCAGEAYCCANPGRTFEQCRSELMTDCTMNAYLDDLAENQITGFSTAHAAMAFERLEQLAAACDANVALWTLSVEGLRGIYQGTVAPMQSCRPSGFPSVRSYGASLASCAQPATHACLFAGTGPNAAPESATCAVRGDAGATCFVDTNCKDGLFCENPQGKYSSGRCQPAKAVGAGCSAPTECASQTCVSGACAMATVQSTWCLKS